MNLSEQMYDLQVQRVAQERARAAESYRRLVLLSVAEDLDGAELAELERAAAVLRVSPADLDRDARSARAVQDLEGKAAALAEDVDQAEAALAELRGLESKQAAALASTRSQIAVEEGKVAAQRKLLDKAAGTRRDCPRLFP